MIRTLVALVVVGCACKGSTHEGPPAGPSGADPWGAPAQAVAAKPADTPEARKQRAEQALARVAVIMPKLAKLRGLAFAHDVPREYQTAADFRAFVRAETATSLPPDRVADTSAALFHLGLLDRPGDLAALEQQAMTTQAGAYYDSQKKKFFLVMVPPTDLMLDMMSAHELTHALQDQHFDLDKLLPPGPATDALDDDHVSARRFVAEGDATFTMFLYVLGSLGKEVTPDLVKIMRAQLDQFATMSPEDMLRQNVLGMSANLDPELQTSLEGFANIPSTVLVPMMDSYLRGSQVIATAYDRGGWKAVDALYAEPPESTEQVLHPTTKLFPERDHPKSVTIARLAHGTQIASLVFGELQWQVYFQLWVPTQKAIASEGWAGDRATVTRRSDGRLVARIATTWDTPKDAAELRAAFITSLAARFPKGSGDPLAAGFDRGDGAGKIFVAERGDAVFIVDGADTRSELDDLVVATQFR